MRIAIVDNDAIVLQNSIKLIKKFRPADEIFGFVDELEFLEFLIKVPCEVIFMDPYMDHMDGVMIAKEIKEIVPKTNIIFLTAYDEYYREAMELHISGYILKPLAKKDIEQELEDLRYPYWDKPNVRIKVNCFDSFEVYTVEGSPIKFERKKAKELFAYLIHKKGVNCSLREAAAALFEDIPFDSKQQNYMQKIISSMMKTLRQNEIEDVVIKGFNEMKVDVEKVDCDYYHFVDLHAEMDFLKEESYMQEYEWA